mmetsp:Transcript_15477/g.20784  ORF Transcript_15477/g.20784 Transcript_15477/m.20784 type:complete len:204 (+) Transcript_15477:572-1183(+)
MMIPTHEWRLSLSSMTGFPPPACVLAGLITESDPLVHRCSIGAGAGICRFSINERSSFMYSMSAMDGVERAPAGKATSETHCCPPQSNWRRSTLDPIRYPSDCFQYSASAAFTRFTCPTSSGFITSSASLSWEKLMPFSALSRAAAAPGAMRSMCGRLYVSQRRVRMARVAASTPRPPFLCAATRSSAPWERGSLVITTTVSV